MFPYFTMTLELAATVASVLGSNIVMATAVSWRFVDWTIIILAATLPALVILYLHETYSPVLLQWKAQQRRRQTGDDCYRALLEFKKVPISRRLHNALHRPVIFFWRAYHRVVCRIHGVYLHHSLHLHCRLHCNL